MNIFHPFFLNFKLRNCFNEHLSTVVKMYLVGVNFIHICSMLINKKNTNCIFKSTYDIHNLWFYSFSFLYILYSHF
jgi:hypothetical protein